MSNTKEQSKAIHRFFDNAQGVALVDRMNVTATPLADAETRALLEQIERAGFVVLRQLLTPAEVAERRQRGHAGFGNGGVRRHGVQKAPRF